MNADILPGPGGFESAIIDVQRFLRLTSSMFPKSTLSLGWVTGPITSFRNNYYDWQMVTAMHDVCETYGINQPLTFAVRAAYLRQSLHPLLWLCEMTGASLTVYSQENDFVSIDNLLFIRSYLSHSKLYYDLPLMLKREFTLRKDEVNHISAEITSFNSDTWSIVRTDAGESIYMGTEAIVIQDCLLVHKAPVHTDNHALTVKGHVTFLDSPELNTEEETYLRVVLHVTQGSSPSVLSGIRCELSSKGKVSIVTQGIPGVDKEVMDSISTTGDCYSLVVVDNPTEGVTSFTVEALKACQADSPIVLEEKTITLETIGITLDGTHLALRTSGEGFTVVNHFHIESGLVY